MWFFITIVYLIKYAATIFWILDICNMPFMEIFDTVYPLNGLFYLLFWFFIGGISIKSGDK